MTYQVTDIWLDEDNIDVGEHFSRAHLAVDDLDMEFDDDAELEHIESAAKVSWVAGRRLCSSFNLTHWFLPRQLQELRQLSAQLYAWTGDGTISNEASLPGTASRAMVSTNHSHEPGHLYSALAKEWGDFDLEPVYTPLGGQLTWL